MSHGRRALNDLVRDLLRDAADAGRVRDDVPPAELAAFCLHALGAAADAPSRAAVRRLVDLTLAAVRPVESPADRQPPAVTRSRSR
jgi:hypothetical protein